MQVDRKIIESINKECYGQELDIKKTLITKANIQKISLLFWSVTRKTNQIEKLIVEETTMMDSIQPKKKT